MTARRIQLSRKRGWRIPVNTIKIDRSTKWGNPFKVGDSVADPLSGESVSVATRELAIALFASHLTTGAGLQLARAAVRELRGKNLACWCKDGQSCHGDVLLRIANSTAARKCAA